MMDFWAFLWSLIMAEYEGKSLEADRILGIIFGG